MILIFGVQVGQGGKLVEADEPIHTQAQENDNQNTGEYLVQHVTVFDSQQVVAQSFLGADPLSDNSFRPDSREGTAAGILTRRYVFHLPAP